MAITAWDKPQATRAAAEVAGSSGAISYTRCKETPDTHVRYYSAVLDLRARWNRPVLPLLSSCHSYLRVTDYCSMILLMPGVESDTLCSPREIDG